MLGVRSGIFLSEDGCLLVLHALSQLKLQLSQLILEISHNVAVLSCESLNSFLEADDEHILLVNSHRVMRLGSD